MGKQYDLNQPNDRSERARQAAYAMHRKHGPNMAAAHAALRARTPEQIHALAMKAAGASIVARRAQKKPDIATALRHLEWLREELDELERALRGENRG